MNSKKKVIHVSELGEYYSHEEIAEIIELKRNPDNWYMTMGRLNSGRTPYPKILASEILNHDQPMPREVREFLAGFVLKRLKSDIRNLPYDELSPEERTRYRKHDAHIHREGFNNGNDDRKWSEICIELSNEYNVEYETIDKDVRGRRNKPRY